MRTSIVDKALAGCHRSTQHPDHKNPPFACVQSRVYIPLYWACHSWRAGWKSLFFPTPAGTLFNHRDSPWLQQWIAHVLCCVLFISRYCLPVCCATLKQKKTNMPSIHTRWRCSTRRCPLHPTLSCFMPLGKWPVKSFFSRRWINVLASPLSLFNISVLHRKTAR